MNFRFIKKGIVLAMLTGAMLFPGKEVSAAEKTGCFHFSKIGLQEMKEKDYLLSTSAKIEKCVEEVKGKYSYMAFPKVDNGNYVYVKSEPSAESDWVGKLYQDNAAIVVETTGEWTKIISGKISGYVYTEYLVTGKEADTKAKEILTAKHPGAVVTVLDEVTVRNSFTYGESREEEEARLAKEAERLAREDAQKRQSVVDFAMQFVGNPYKWGGTSLTKGADCSGFVKSVYANFGVGMPRTSGAMRSVGVEVSYSDVKPGDVICYQGHVGIYAGNGQIVNAIDDAHGIGVSSATYAKIITVRRML